jgi:hypothetical protein
MNAKEELMDALFTKARIKCAKIFRESYENGTKITNYILHVNYNQSELIDFFKSLDFEYDNGYGGQELYGLVWLDNDTWLSRGEYDGSEWWDYNSLPEIPKELIK